MHRIGEYFDNQLKEGIIPNAVCAVYKNGKELYRHCCGYSDLRTNAPVKENSIFRLASMTKPITAVAVLIAVERGLLDLHKPLSNLIPAPYINRIICSSSSSKMRFMALRSRRCFDAMDLKPSA